MSHISNEIIQICRTKLASKKEELLNRVRASKSELYTRETGGDEIDQSIAILAENTLLTNQERMRTQLLEIEYALARIENGNFGICEETNEPIEPERLLAMPWTRLSIEGAELREAQMSKWAR